MSLLLLKKRRDYKQTRKMKFIIKTEKGTEIELEENTEIDISIDDKHYLISIKT